MGGAKRGAPAEIYAPFGSLAPDGLAADYAQLMLFIIFGTRGVTTTPDRGTFHCPQCGTQRDYAQKRVRRFFTLYFIPLIPLDQVGEYVECGVCQGTYDLAVLSFDPAAQHEAFMAEFQVAVRDVLIQMMLADGEVSPDEVQAIQVICADIGGFQLTPEAIDLLAEKAKTRSESVIDTVRRQTPMLNANGKEAVIRAAATVAMADGDFDEREQRFLAALGQALEMSDAHVRGVVAEVLEQPGGGAAA